MSLVNKKFHYIYKIIHDDGFYYIGRHSTDNIDDGYMGSGIWVKRASKHKLRKEILQIANTFDELTILEEQYITENFDNPLCMNMKRASVGWTPQDAKKVVTKQILDGKNALCNGRKIKRHVIDDEARLKGAKTIKSMFDAGIHPLGGELARNRIQQQIDSGTHPGTMVFSKIHICPQCGKKGKGAVMFKHHYKNCKNVKN